MVYCGNFPLLLMTTTWFGDGDDEDDKTEQKGGPDAGNYEPPKNLPIPGEGDPVDNSQQ